MRGGAWGWLVIAAVAPLGACEALFPLRVRDDADAAVDAAGALDAGPDAPAPACVLAAGPPRPASAPSGGDQTVVVAVRTLGLPDGGAPVGLDLDGRCTCAPGAGELGAPSCISSAPHCDDPGGRDSAGDVFFGTLNDYLSSTKGGTLQSRVTAGKLGFLFEIDGYNGGPEDDRVEIVGYRSNGLIVDSFGDYGTPKWDGADTWTVDPASAIGTELDGGYSYVPLFSGEGYVTQGTLVARMNEYDLGVGFGLLPLYDFRVVAALSADDAGYRIEGQFAGRARTDDVFALLARVELGPGNYLCANGSLFTSFVNEICGSADIRGKASEDNESLPCNATSLGFAFTAVSAKLGAPVAVTYPSPGCDGGVTCPPP